MRRAVVVPVLAGILACGPGEVLQPPSVGADEVDAGGHDSGTMRHPPDSGTGRDGNGSRSADSGSPSADSGSPSADSGSRSSDSGSPSADSGSASSDSGAASSDSGSASSDSGSPSSDGGSPSADTGSPSVADAGTPSDPHLAFALNLINNARMMGGAAPLMLDPTMTACAYRHAMDVELCAGGNFSNFVMCAHNDFRMGDHCGAFAENQGIGGGDEDYAFQSVFNAMMGEGPPPPGTDNHYWNIMNPAETAVGIGIYLANGAVWISEEFR
jgi:hypothetical protein